MLTKKITFALVDWIREFRVGIRIYLLMSLKSFFFGNWNILNFNFDIFL